MNKNITVLKGDGIGPEIVDQAIKVLNAVEKKYGHKFNYTEVDIGGCSIDKHGVPITNEGMEICKSSDSVLLGAVGGPKWDNVDPSIRPEKALLAVRSELGLFANLRPTKLFLQLANSSPLKESIVGNGIDLMIVRELTGGIYFGKRRMYFFICFYFILFFCDVLFLEHFGEEKRKGKKCIKNVMQKLF